MNYNHANNPEAGAQVLIKAFSFFHEDTPEVLEYKGPQRMQQVNFVPQDLTKPNAMTAEYRFLQNHNVYTFGKNDIFVHNGSYYESMSKQQVAGMIADDCPDLLAQADNKRFLMSGVEGMFYNNALRIDSLTQSETLVPFMNCCIDTVACRFVQPDSNYFLSYRLNATYVFEWTCPNFDRFLADAMGGDLSLIERVWQMLGYLLTMDNRGKKIFLLQGVANTGKSLLSNLIQSYYPPYMRCNIQIHDLGDRFVPSQLQGKALCISSDMPAAPIGEKAAGELKSLSGNDLTTADVKFDQAITLNNQARFVIVTNHLFKVRVDDPALMQRIVVIPFLRAKEPSELDPGLYGKIDSERDVIASRAIRTYLSMIHCGGYPYSFCGNCAVNEGMAKPKCSPAMMCEYMRMFVKEHLVPDAGSYVGISDAHMLFCAEYGDIYINTFSECFVKTAAERCQVQKGRVHDCAVLHGVRLV